MRHRPDPKAVFASQVAAGLAVLPVLMLLIWEISKDSADDASMRGLGLILAATPFLYIFAAFGAFTIGSILLQLSIVRLRTYLSMAVVLSILLAFAFALMAFEPANFVSTDAAASFGFVLALTLASMVPAAGSWWFLRGRNLDV